MQLLEATQLLTKIIGECPKIEGCNIMFMSPKPQIKVAEGYKIHMTKDFEIDKETLSCIENIVTKHNLAYLEDKNGLMIYRKR